jgi:AcrR family transcriptional regulator
MATPVQGERRNRPTHRAAIIDRAVDVASTDGLEGLTIGRLAAELGISKSGLFGHFGSKEELQLATFDEAARRFIAKVVKPALSHPEGGPRLRALCERYVAYVERPVFPGGCFLATASIEFDGRPGPVRDRIRDGVAAWLGELERQARLAGDPDPAQLAFEVHALVQGANAAFQLLGDRTAFQRAREAIDRRLSGLADRT